MTTPRIRTVLPSGASPPGNVDAASCRIDKVDAASRRIIDAARCRVYGHATRRRVSARGALLAACLALLVAAQRLSAQPYELSALPVDGGGHVSSAGDFSLVGKIERPEAGSTVMTGGDFQLVAKDIRVQNDEELGESESSDPGLCGQAGALPLAGIVSIMGLMLLRSGRGRRT